jgi:hypothetical protein
MPFKLLATLLPTSGALALVLPSLSARADPPLTDLVLSGSETVEMTVSNTNACYVDSDSIFNAQLTDPASGQIISINVLGTVGDHPARASDGHAQLTMLGFDSTKADPIVNWAATGGTVALDNLDTQVALDDGSASTHGALGHIEADLTSPNGAIHISGPFACHLAG